MDYIEKVLEKLKELARKLIESLLGPEAEPEPELIPIPVNDRHRRGGASSLTSSLKAWRYETWQRNL